MMDKAFLVPGEYSGVQNYFLGFSEAYDVLETTRSLHQHSSSKTNDGPDYGNEAINSMVARMEALEKIGASATSVVQLGWLLKEIEQRTFEEQANRLIETGDASVWTSPSEICQLASVALLLEAEVEERIAN